jgi:hypothetical protein
MSKSKQQGTRHESWIVNQLMSVGLSAKRIAEGGSADEGDVELLVKDQRWVLEGKARQNLNIQKTLAKARKKAGDNTPVAVIWKRLVKVKGYENRQPVEGERVTVTLSWDDFVSLLTKENNNE